MACRQRLSPVVLLESTYRDEFEREPRIELLNIEHEKRTL